MFYLSIVVGKIIISTLRLSGKGGSALPGLIIEKINSNFLTKFGEVSGHNAIIVTGTNGKTTTTKALVEIFSKYGESVLTNKSGSNFNRGIISSIVEDATWGGRFKSTVAIFEVDEAYAPQVAKALKPKQLVALNVFRDQLDRFGELDKTASCIEEAANYSEKVVVNANDPNLKQLIESHDNSISFGMSADLQKRLPSDDQLHSKKTATEDIEAGILLTKSQHKDGTQQIEIEYKNKLIELNTKLIGLHNSINIAAVFAVCVTWGMKPDMLIKTIPDIKPAFGRGELISYKEGKVLLMLVKNPTGFNQILSTLSQDNVSPSIIAINDQIADGRDVSWLWDVDFENNKSIISSELICSGSRGYDIALRLKYVTGKEVAVETDIESAISRLEINNSEQVIVATYTAMLKIRQILGRDSNIKEFWK